MSRRPARPAAVTLVMVVIAVTLAACDLRLETAAPEPLVPDAAETVRQRTVADALRLQDLASATEHPDPAVQLLLETVAEASAAHVDALGGVYDPGTDPPDEPVSTADPTAGPGATAGAGTTAAPDATGAPDEAEAPEEAEAGDPGTEPGTEPGEIDEAAVESLVTALAETATTALGDADEIEDGTVARLLGAVAASRLVLGERLERVLGVDAAERAEAWHVLPPDPAGPPPGVPTPAALPLVTAEDLAGQAWEVVAARREGDGRAAAAGRAAAHRDRAQAWAVSTDVAGSGLDPRRTSYALPPGLLEGEDPAADLAALETALADAYLALVARAEPLSRAPLVAASADAAAVAAALTGQVPAFPGMPELAP